MYGMVCGTRGDVTEGDHSSDRDVDVVRRPLHKRFHISAHTGRRRRLSFVRKIHDNCHLIMARTRSVN